ncbi:MAG: class I SAM-dependent methyltransferase [Verrucomicrobiota bacterium JB022]|nr:class I SAM-dependent methyltransferase [Verrucomicrobiota bacterium JB022]
MSSSPAEDRAAFLAEINKHIPAGVDWKKGAIDYVSNLIQQGGDGNRAYLMAKPFIGGPDYKSFYDHIYRFLNAFETMDLPMRARVLDVAAGPGWISHYLAKLGYQVVGTDICADLLELARERCETEPAPPYGANVPLSARFITHDLEEGPIEGEEPFDAAIIESALHHFVDPISALENVRASLKEDGVLCILEGVRAGTPEETAELLEVMEKYQTLERPYSRDQLVRMLKMTGFSHFEFFSSINGWFNLEQPQDQQRLNTQKQSVKHFNFLLASTSDKFFKDVLKRPAASETVALEGMFPPEVKGFRWAEANAEIYLPPHQPLTLSLRNPILPSGQHQLVQISSDGVEVARATLTHPGKTGEVVIEADVTARRLRLRSSFQWSPAWDGQNDSRLLSYQIKW